MPSKGRSDIDKQGIGSDNGPDNDKSGMLDDIVDEWTGEGPAHYLQSTKIQLVEEHVLCQILGEKTKLRCWRMMWHGWTEQ